MKDNASDNSDYQFSPSQNPPAIRRAAATSPLLKQAQSNRPQAPPSFARKLAVADASAFCASRMDCSNVFLTQSSMHSWERVSARVRVFSMMVLMTPANCCRVSSVEHLRMAS